MANTFSDPDKLTCLADGVDAITWSDLPPDTVITSLQLIDGNPMAGATGKYVTANGYWRATFDPAGEYVFTFAAKGYEPRSFLVTATAV